VFFNSRENIDEQIEQVMVEIGCIQQHMTPVLHDCLRVFLEENADPIRELFGNFREAYRTEAED